MAPHSADAPQPVRLQQASEVSMNLRAVGIGLVFLVLGLLAAFHPMWISGFGLVPGDRGDTIFFIYLLEHQWQWLSGTGTAPGFWDPPVGYPMTGALAHGDIMLTFVPLYAPWRAMGASPETAYQLWLVAVSSVNFAGMGWILRRTFSVGVLAASFGACFFAFSSARMAQIGHVQLLPQIFVLGAFVAVVVFFRAPRNSDAAVEPSASRAERTRCDRWAIACYAGCVVAQFFGGYYMGYFVILVSGVALGCALVLKSHRAFVLARLRERAVGLASGAAVTLACLLPLAARHYEASEISRRVGVGAGEIRLPRLASYFYMGPESVVYGWLARLWPFSEIPEAHEQAIGLGLLTSGVVLYVFWQNRHRPAVRFAAILVLTLVVALTWFPFEVRLWRLWYYTVPGLSVVRAVSRIGLLLSIPAALALAWFVCARDRNSRAMAAGTIAIASLCLVEQVRHVPTFDKRLWHCEVETHVSRIDPAAAAFHLVGDNEDNLQALAVAQRAGVPTVNFVGGAFPKAWTLFESQVLPGHTHEEVRAALRSYLKAQGVVSASVQRLEPMGAGECAARIGGVN